MIYISTSLYNINRARQIIKMLEEKKISLTYNWTNCIATTDIEELKKYGEAELNGIKKAKCFLFITPARNGSHIEFGIALALGIPIVMLMEAEIEPQPFYYDNIVTVFYNVDDAIKHVQLILGNQ